MSRIRVGDIVSLKAIDDKIYYIVTDVTNLTQEGDEQDNIECEITLIYPVAPHPEPKKIGADKLEILQEFGSKGYEYVMTFCQTERERMGYYERPRYLDMVGDKITYVRNDNKPKNELVQYKSTARVSANDIKRILGDEESDKRIKTYLSEMDSHLELLLKAIDEENEEEIEFHKEVLEEIRRSLMELEYFSI